MSPSSTLTPARKHRKLLKTPSGPEEVWSEAIEQIFVSGLKAYWNSPFANPHGARGRSRWRNQYLVEYLQKNGIERSKKQVASHIQVLRNMWKGQPEYHLVSGGEDSILDSEHLPTQPHPVKLEDQYDTSNLISMDDHHSDTSSSSPIDILSTPTTDPYSPDSLASSLSNDSPRTISSLPDTPESYNIQLHPSSRIKVAQSPLRHGHLPDIRTDDLHSYHNHHDDPSSASLLLKSPTSAVSPSSTPNNIPLNNRITSFSLTAEGMTPFQVKVDALVPPPVHGGHTAPVMIHTKLAVAHQSDSRCPSAFNGFNGSVTVASVWSNFACCVTRVFVGRTCVSEESDALDVARIELGTVVAALPVSQLTRCRWLDAAAPTNIVQDIVVDKLAVFRAIYQLDRSGRGAYPSVELLTYSKVTSSPHSPPPSSAATTTTTTTTGAPLSGSPTKPLFPAPHDSPYYQPPSTSPLLQQQQQGTDGYYHQMNNGYVSPMSAPPTMQHHPHSYHHSHSHPHHHHQHHGSIHSPTSPPMTY